MMHNVVFTRADNPLDSPLMSPLSVEMSVEQSDGHNDGQLQKPWLYGCVVDEIT
jgi:hypothetical protein